MPASPWDDGSLALKGDIICRKISCANWPLASLHQIGATVHVSTDLAIDAPLAADLETDLLRPFSSTDADVDPLRVRKTIYIPTPFVGLFLKRYFTSAEAWTHLCGSIITGGLEVYCCPIIDWLRVDLTLKAGNYKSPLAMPHLLQRALDNTAWRLSFRALIVATPGMLKLTLALGFLVDHRGDLDTGRHVPHHSFLLWK